MRTRRGARIVRRAHKALCVACGLVVASTMLGLGSGAAGAQDTGTLGGYSGSAIASGLHARYAPQGLLPTGPPVDLGAPDALATIASGPATFARASIADPGDLLANPSALLALLSPEVPTIPAYPFRIAASSGVGEPAAESNPAPGLHAAVEVGPGSSSALARMPLLAAPALATIGTMAAYATTETDGSTVTVHARSELTGIDILGIVKIEGLVSDVTATSSGGDTELSGGTTPGAITVMGIPATLDAEGLSAPLGPLDLGHLLEDLGIRITLPGPLELDGGSSGRLATTGLRIDLHLSDQTIPGLTALLGGLPVIPPLVPGLPSVEDLLAVAYAEHLVAVDIGRADVSLTARAPGQRPTSSPPASTPTATGSTGTPLPPSTGGSLPPANTPVATTPTGPSVVTDEVPAASFATGVGALGVLLLLLQPFIGDRLARFAAAQLATNQEDCSWERR